MPVFILKLLAMSSMLTDHIAIEFVSPYHFVMRKVIGRLAFVIYTFLIAESYYHLKERPRRLKIHVLKLIILAAITEVPYDYFEGRRIVDSSSQNVIWTLLLGFILLIITGYIKEKIQSKTYEIGINVCICIAIGLGAHHLKSEYGIAGVLLIMMFYIYLYMANKIGWIQKIVCLVLIEAIFCFLYVWSCTDFGGWPEIVACGHDLREWGIGVALTIAPLVCYNRKIGYHSKWFSWLYSCFYPLQFILLIIMRYHI